MKKYLAWTMAAVTAAGLAGQYGVARAATVSNVTTSITNPVLNQPYLQRVKFSFDGGYGPNVSVSGLPPGISLQNSSAGYTNQIYALSQRDSDGYYFVDLFGTPSASGMYNIQFFFFDAVHTFEVYKNYALTVATTTWPPSGTVAVIRMYNSRLADHFYTTDPVEAQNAALQGYRAEGQLGYIYATNNPNNISLYRMYNPSTRHHFYTANALEMLSAQQSGFIWESTLGYLPAASSPGSGSQIWRLYDPRTGDHVYTSDYGEVNALSGAGGAGYKWEGNLDGRLLP